MSLSLSSYEIKPKVVKCGAVQTIAVLPVGECARFDNEEKYTVTIMPMEHSDDTYIEDSLYEMPGLFHELELKPENGILTFEYSFDEEQEWTIDVKQKDMKSEVLRFHIYSLFDDLYGRNPYKGDLHSHSCRSDGKEEPAIVAANYRKAGFDFFALTDHHAFQPSQEAMDKYRGVAIDLKICHGEEIHLKGEYIHIVNFGGSYSINELYYGNPEKYHNEIKEYSKTLTPPKGVNALEYAYRKWIYDEIKKSGGITIIPHPFWIHYPHQYNMRSKMLDYVFETGIFDAFELLGGQSVHENNLQIAAYIDQCSKGRQIPVVGSSDSHGTDPAVYFKQCKTIVFSKDLEVQSICNSIKELYSVAIEEMPGEEYRVYGSFRMVKYARFLLTHYFPKHDELCFEEGRLMKNYITGDMDAKYQLEKLHGRTAKFMEDELKASDKLRPGTQR